MYKYILYIDNISLTYFYDLLLQIEIAFLY